MYMYIHIIYMYIHIAPNFHRSCKLKRFAETIFADQRNPVSHSFYLCLFAVPDQSAKNVKIMRLVTLALYGIHVYIYTTYMYIHVV